jgi:hypothetical protein
MQIRAMQIRAMQIQSATPIPSRAMQIQSRDGDGAVRTRGRAMSPQNLLGTRRALRRTLPLYT